MGNQVNKPTYDAQRVSIDNEAVNGGKVTGTAVDVTGWEFTRAEWSYDMSGGAAATDTLTFTFQASQDGGATYKPLTKTASDDTVSVFAPIWTITSGEDTADLSTGDLGAIHVIGLTHIKAEALHTDVAGTATASDKITVTLRPCRE